MKFNTKKSKIPRQDEHWTFFDGNVHQGLSLHRPVRDIHNGLPNNRLLRVRRDNHNGLK